MARKRRTFLPQTREAASLLGAQVGIARRERRWTIQELADRVGADRATVAKVERGDPSVGIGVAFDTATILGITLFPGPAGPGRDELKRMEERLTLLPARVRPRPEVDDDF